MMPKPPQLTPFTDYSLFYYFMLWFSLLAVSLLFILINGIDYVSWPRLLPPTDIIYYSGPGFRSAHNGKGLNTKKEGFGIPQRARWLGKARSRVGVEEVEMGELKKRVD